jgi:hypothetical protein
MLGHGHGLAEIFLRAAPFEYLDEEWNDRFAIEIRRRHCAAFLWL